MMFLQDIRPKNNKVPIGPRLVRKPDVFKCTYDGNLPITKNLSASSWFVLAWIWVEFIFDLVSVWFCVCKSSSNQSCILQLPIYDASVGFNVKANICLNLYRH